MQDPLEEKNSDGRFYVGLVVMVILVAIGIGFMISHERGGFGPPPPPNPADIRSNNLAAPGLTDADVLAFTTRVITRAVSFDARNFANQMSIIEPYFTSDGWTLFNRTLDRFDVRTMMQTGGFKASPELRGQPAIYSKGVDAAIFHWRISVPITLHMAAGDRNVDRDLVVYVRVIRRPTNQFPEGIAIDSVNFQLDASTLPSSGG